MLKLIMILSFSVSSMSVYADVATLSELCAGNYWVESPLHQYNGAKRIHELSSTEVYEVSFAEDCSEASVKFIGEYLPNGQLVEDGQGFVDQVLVQKKKGIMQWEGQHVVIYLSDEGELIYDVKHRFSLEIKTLNPKKPKYLADPSGSVSANNQ